MPNTAGRAPLRLRPAVFGDAPLLSRLCKLCFAGEMSVEDWSAEALSTLLAQPGCFGIVAESGPVARGEELPAGFVLARAVAGECEILALGVQPARRRGGCGSALLEALLGQALGLACPRVLLEVAVDNEGACALYRRAGFRPVGRRRRYYRRQRGLAVDALLLEFEPNSARLPQVPPVNA